MPRYIIAATGGTFDIIHKGHLALLEKAFAISDHVIIGLTSDEFSANKKPLNGYQKRYENLQSAISLYHNTSDYTISKLDDYFGPAVLNKDVQALITSDETRFRGEQLNKLRLEKNLAPVDIISIPMTLAQDGTRISSSRIKNQEIDHEGKLLD